MRYVKYQLKPYIRTASTVLYMADKKQVLIWNEAGQTTVQLSMKAEVRRVLCSRQLSVLLWIQIVNEVEGRDWKIIRGSCAFVRQLLNKVWRVSRNGFETCDLVRSSKLEVCRPSRLGCYGNRWRRPADELRQCGTSAWVTAIVISHAERKCPSAKGLNPWPNYMDETQHLRTRTSGKNVGNLTVLKIHTVGKNLGEYLDPKS